MFCQRQAEVMPDWRQTSEEYRYARILVTDDTPATGGDSLTEVEIAWVADQWLRQESWVTYPEVVLSDFPGRPDLVATRNGICQVIECKKGLTMKVLEQAVRWHFHARPEQSGMPHLVWIACGPTTKRNSELFNWLLHQFGIGVLEIRKSSVHAHRTSAGIRECVSYSVSLLKQARVQPGSRKFAGVLKAQLNDNMRCAVPGARGGDTEYMTPFKRTLTRVVELLDANPGKEFHIGWIIDHVNANGGHHYMSDASAKNALASHLDRLGYPRTRDYGPWFASRVKKQ